MAGYYPDKMTNPYNARDVYTHVGNGRYRSASGVVKSYTEWQAYFKTQGARGVFNLPGFETGWMPPPASGPTREAAAQRVGSASSSTGSTYSLDTASIQRALNGFPSSLARLTVDGVFGPKTQARLREFQKQRGLPQTGVADQATRHALNNPLPAASAPVASSTTPPATTPVVPLVNQRIAELAARDYSGYVILGVAAILLVGLLRR